MSNRTEVFIGLGSNLDNPVQQLEQACKELASIEQTAFIRCSSFYHSQPMGPVEQPDYVNAVAQLLTSLTPWQLLDALQSLETLHHRVREVHWGPRTLDLDILLYGEDQVAEQRLIIPHPGLCERNFVLYPLAELVGQDFILPGGEQLGELLSKVSMQGLELLDRT